MYTQSVYVDGVNKQDYEKLKKSAPMFKMLNVEITDVMVAGFVAMNQVNSTLPVHEAVIRVKSTVSDGGTGYYVKLDILD